MALPIMPVSKNHISCNDKLLENHVTIILFFGRTLQFIGIIHGYNIN